MRILDVALKDLRQVARDRMSALFLVVMPIVFTAFMGAIFRFDGGTEDPRLAVGLLVQDDAAHPVVVALAQVLYSSEAVRIERLDGGDIEDLERRVRRADLAAGIVVPPGFGEAVLRGEALPLRVLVDPGSQVATVVQEAANTVATRLVSAVAAADLSTEAFAEAQGFADEGARRAYWEASLARAAEAWANPPLTIEVRHTGEVPKEQEDAPSGYAQASPGIMVQFAIFGLITSGTVLVLERTQGTLWRLLTTPIRRAEIIAGHVLAMFAIVVGQELLLVVFGQLALGVNYAAAPPAVLVMLVAMGLFAASLGLLIGAVARSEDQVIMYSLIAMFVLAGLGGAWFPLDITGPTFWKVGHALPTAWAMDGLQNVVIRGLALDSVLRPAGIIVAWAVALFGLGVWRLGRE